MQDVMLGATVCKAAAEQINTEDLIPIMPMWNAVKEELSQ